MCDNEWICKPKLRLEFTKSEICINMQQMRLNSGRRDFNDSKSDLEFALRVFARSSNRAKTAPSWCAFRSVDDLIMPIRSWIVLPSTLSHQKTNHSDTNWNHRKIATNYCWTHIVFIWWIAIAKRSVLPPKGGFVLSCEMLSLVQDVVDTRDDLTTRAREICATMTNTAPNVGFSFTFWWDHHENSNCLMCSYWSRVSRISQRRSSSIRFRFVLGEFWVRHMSGLPRWLPGLYILLAIILVQTPIIADYLIGHICVVHFSKISVWLILCASSAHDLAARSKINFSENTKP